MKNQPLKGYRQLSQVETDLINEIKNMASQVGDLVTKLTLDGDLDQRWIALGKTDLQRGFMALTRAVAQPTTF